MKKWGITLVAILALLILGLPGLMGIVSEKRIKQLIQTLPTSSVKATLINYHRGWFHSDITLSLTMPDLGHDPKVLPSLELNENVTHGPIIFTTHFPFIRFGQASAKGDLSLPESSLPTLKSYIDQSTLAYNQLFLHYLGRLDFTMIVPDLNIHHPAPQQFQVTLEGLAIEGNMSRHGNHVNTHSSLANLVWADQDATFNLVNIKEASTLSQNYGTLWLGKMDLGLEQASIKDNQGVGFSLKGLTYTSSTQDKKGLLSAKTEINLASIIGLKGVTYGPAKVVLNLSNVNARPLAKLKELMQLMSQDNASVAPQHVQRLIIQTISRGLSVELSPVTITTTNGDIKGELSLTLPNLIDHQKANDLKQLSIFDLLQQMTASLDLTVPKVILVDNLNHVVLHNMSMMGQVLGQNTQVQSDLDAVAKAKVNAQLNSWMNAGFLTQADNNYVVHVTYNQAKLLINGKPLFGGSVSPAVNNNAVATPDPTPVLPLTSPGNTGSMAVVNESGSAPVSTTDSGSSPASMETASKP